MVEESNEVKPPIKYASLKRYVKSIEERRIGGDATEELIGELEFIAEAIWLKAIEHADNDDRQTVQKQDIQLAYDEIFEPHDLLMDVADRVGEMSEELESMAKKSPAFPHVTENDE